MRVWIIIALFAILAILSAYYFPLWVGPLPPDLPLPDL